jgi:hypothetical protein
MKVSRKISQNESKRKVNTLEDNFYHFVSQVQEGFNTQAKNVQTGFNEQAEILAAMIEVLGIKDKVSEAVLTTRKENATKEAEKSKALLETWKSQGLVVPADTVDGKSVLVCKEFDATTNEVIHPGWLRLEVPGIKPEFQAQILGKKVGDSFSPTKDHRVEVVEIYHIDEVRAAELKAASEKQPEPVQP